MNISITNNGAEYLVQLEGRMDTTTAPEAEKKLAEIMESADKLVLDMKELAYISSAGLRVLLGAQKKMTARKGEMILKNVSEMVLEVLEVTGFTDILTIEK